MEAAWSLAAAAGLGPGGSARIAGCEVVAVAAICAVLMIYLVTLKRCLSRRAEHAMSWGATIALYGLASLYRPLCSCTPGAVHRRAYLRWVCAMSAGVLQTQ
eukprot:GHRQ01027358.1.p1 GENE.GHRQ01027358.1~~GHRQ01027358.1.p1  ORF type:complete len:102 (+),score=1.98 GHRQ01027358.1:439-744(+)